MDSKSVLKRKAVQQGRPMFQSKQTDSNAKWPCEWCMRATCKAKGGYEEPCPVERGEELPEELKYPKESSMNDLNFYRNKAETFEWLCRQFKKRQEVTLDYYCSACDLTFAIAYETDKVERLHCPKCRELFA